MAIIVSQVKTRLKDGSSHQQIIESARKTAQLRPEQIKRSYLIKSSVDARHQENILLVSSVGFELHTAKEEQQTVARLQRTKAASSVKWEEKQPLEFVQGQSPMEHPPVVVGFGPAGMFAALTLARLGYCPVVLERGADVDSRVQDPRCDFVLEEMIRHGAPEEIRYRQKPHVGTDLLRGVVKSIREEIIRLGGQVLFETKMERVVLRQGRVQAVKSSAGEIPTQVLVLAIGHSARDTFEQLCADGVFLEPKPFSVGVRIEQRQSVIDAGLYGKQAGHPALPKGEYQLSWRDEQGRGVYTFCMCPGGYVVASSSEEETVVTNGMSEYARDGENANAALVVSVDASDFGSGVLDGVAFQRRLEHQAFVLGGKDYRAPAQSVKSYLEAAAPDLSQAATAPSFSCGVREADLHSLFPQPINQMLEQGLRRFNRRLPGFADADAVMTGVETRTSSPVRITRDAQSFQALGMQGLYPCGEGAGYAGGIMSAAVDGVRIAQQIIGQYAPVKQ